MNFLKDLCIKNFVCLKKFRREFSISYFLYMLYINLKIHKTNKKFCISFILLNKITNCFISSYMWHWTPHRRYQLTSFSTRHFSQSCHKSSNFLTKKICDCLALYCLYIIGYFGTFPKNKKETKIARIIIKICGGL